MADWKNKLYFGDNLGILREHVPDESVDLVYLDPPFNSNATYNVLFKEASGEGSAAQIHAFDRHLALEHGVRVRLPGCRAVCPSRTSRTSYRRCARTSARTT